jgi:hypothetical protein
MAAFEIFYGEKGLWRVCRGQGLVEGALRNRKSALGFAKSESPNKDGTIKFRAGPIAQRTVRSRRSI